jgi:uncharacterized protein (TIGR03437 family)
VFIRDSPAAIYYASPTQVNLLVPSDLTPGPATLRLALDGRSGPSIPIVLRRAAPALFVAGNRTAIALRPDGSVVTAARPARPGDTVTLYATGLGDLVPPLPPAQIPRSARSIERTEELRITLNGIPSPASAILYAGAAPGFAGLYQINWTVPPVPAPQPAIRVELGDESSPDGVILEAVP